MKVVVLRHRGVRCAMPVEQVQSVAREPEGAVLALWDGHEGESAERVRHLAVRTREGLRWVSATDVQHREASAPLEIGLLLRGPEGVPSFVAGLVTVDGELVWLADFSLVGGAAE